MTQNTATALLQQDLEKSGLEISDLGAYVAQEAEIAAVGLKAALYLGSGPAVTAPGYIIPYYDAAGNRVPFYRMRLFHPNPKGAKYLQPANVGSWVYFPKQFRSLLQQAVSAGRKVPVIVTEGEKKAAKAAACGFLSCALGGVYNWRSKTVVFPEETELAKNREGQIIAKIKGNLTESMTMDRRGILANGMQHLIQIVRQHNLQVVILFDSDYPINPDVQKAAAELAFEFRSNGIPTKDIRQLSLTTGEGKKVGLDDYLVDNGVMALHKELDKCLNAKNAYPIHPEMRSLLARQLDARLDRSEYKDLALMILADMDVNGRRMIDKNSGAPFYFDEVEKVLMPVNLLHNHEEPLHETRFGEFLYRRYDLSQADHRLLAWLAAGFTGEEPIETVEPRSVFTLTKDGLAYQIDDGHFALITSDPQVPIVIKTNGSDGILFKAKQVEPVNANELIRGVKQQVYWLSQNPPFEDFFWRRAAKQFKFVHPRDCDIMTVLSYLSPWLQRWHGAQLPVELMIGEPGSGKSSMYALRLEILTGRSELRNQPTDIRDWYASITSQGGMHVTDNIGFASKEIKQRLSDEMCRLVTEPKPTVEMRKLFTTSENVRIPVNVVFAMTAIQQPFVNADIMQRSVIMELSAIGDGHASDWNGNQLRLRGGRLGWLCHQLAVLHSFFVRVKENPNFWQEDYRSKHRLAHFEQLFHMMGQVLNIPDLDQLAKSLTESSQNQVSEYDWTMEGLKAFNAAHIVYNKMSSKEQLFTCQDISLWASEQPEYSDNQVLTNSRRLARYIKSHAYMVENLAGFEEVGKTANRQTYRMKVVQ